MYNVYSHYLICVLFWSKNWHNLVNQVNIQTAYYIGRRTGIQSHFCLRIKLAPIHLTKINIFRFKLIYTPNRTSDANFSEARLLKSYGRVCKLYCTRARADENHDSHNRARSKAIVPRYVQRLVKIQSVFTRFLHANKMKRAFSRARSHVNWALAYIFGDAFSATYFTYMMACARA